MDDDFTRRVLLSLDVENYSARTDVEQERVQHALANVMRDTAERAGFDRSRWSVQGSGDGELSVLPAETPEKRVIDDLPRALAESLAAHNGGAPHELKLRLRVAVHQGLVRETPYGHAGAGVTMVSRILDSDPGRLALRECPAADLVLLLSPLLYADLVMQGHTRLSPRDFREVPVVAKTFNSTAWLHVPGVDVRSLPLDAVRRPASGPEPIPASTPGAPLAPNAHNTTVHGGVHGQNVVIGVQNRVGR
ncbi:MULTISPECIES: hypothetical protein [Saccharothrix]|uniref:hypothetical protein n=1 Tax=Saccharothrix TaxID=2071 RepID=UPI0009628BAF|nr:hypothetical protein [Saccharothrix sp. CB00851]OKI18109.1 hypothetical protein A6A25_11040 [Saccharothrix sp. CB00851]